MKTTFRYIIMDDDPVDNFICHTVLKKMLGDPVFHHFTNPEKGLDFLRTQFAAEDDTTPAILFLDINMPRLDGWEVLEEYDKLDDKVKNLIRVYIYSSSIDSGDQQRALENKHVVDYITKPLISERVKAILAANEAKVN